MLRSSLFTLTLCLLSLAAKAHAQNKDLVPPPATAASPPTPILPPEGYTDASDWSVPGSEWQHVTPESEGFSPPRLETLRAFLKTHQTDAMLVISRGHIVFEYGDTKLVSKVASVRKSVLDLLYAVEMQKGEKIDFEKTVVQLGLEEKATPFIEPEQHATLQHLMMARSGIYIPSGNSDQDKLSPKRGTEYPGIHWFYNNWDFDAVGLAFEQITHKDIFDALRDDLAIPLRFQDFDRARQKKNFGQNTRHFEYATYLSTRDMARLGLLAMSHGMWGKTPWADSSLVDFSVYPTTRFADRDELKSEGWTGRWGYGMLWWAWDAPLYPGNVATGPWQGAFSAMGANGQYITAFPFWNLLVVHKVNIDKDESRKITEPTYMTILDMVLDAKCDKDCR
jgi:CubicO group peptidase (beta-lactamase class C family)